MSRYATIDVGSNSVLLLIAEKEANGKWKSLVERSEFSRLGEGLQSTGRLKKEAIERTIKVLADYAQVCHKFRVHQIAAVGTMALRTAENARELVDLASEQCGISIEIIDGTEEARLAFLAVQSGMNLSSEKILVVDVGGGSTEFIYGEGPQILNRISLNIGAIRITENYLKSDPVTPWEFLKALVTIKRDLHYWQPPQPVQTLIGIDGTITTLAAITKEMKSYQPEVIHGLKLSFDEIIRLIERFRELTIEERRQIPGLVPQRADIILAGSLIVYAIMQKANLTEITVSTHGIRHGLLEERF